MSAGQSSVKTHRVSRNETQKRIADGPWPWLFVGPTVAGVLIFYTWPLFKTLYLSFTKVGAFGGSPTWIGAENYRELVGDSNVKLALVNTIIYTGIVLLNIPIATVIANLIHRRGLRGSNVYRVLYFMPFIAMPTAVALVWRLIYNGNFGVLNWFLSLIGINGPHWTSTPGYAIVAIGVVGLWTSLGLSIIILGAGLRSIPREYYEAAEIDGAGRLAQLIRITIPLLTPSIFFVTVTSIISGFQMFDLLYAIMGVRNPALNESQSLVYIFYNVGFIQANKGYASAIGGLILVLIGALTLLQFRLQRRWVIYA